MMRGFVDSEKYGKGGRIVRGGGRGGGGREVKTQRSLRRFNNARLFAE